MIFNDQDQNQKAIFQVGVDYSVIVRNIDWKINSNKKVTCHFLKNDSNKNGIKNSLDIPSTVQVAIVEQVECLLDLYGESEISPLFS